jgi:hypothetical protein
MKEILEEIKRQIIEEDGNGHFRNKKAEDITKVIRIKQGEEFTAVNKILIHCDETGAFLGVLTKPENYNIHQRV